MCGEIALEKNPGLHTFKRVAVVSLVKQRYNNGDCHNKTQPAKTVSRKHRHAKGA